MAEHLGAPNPNAPADTGGTDVEDDYLQAFRIYVPTPGAIANQMGVTDDGSAGSSLQLGAPMDITSAMRDNSFTGFGVRTHGHIFFDGRGATGAVNDGGNGLDAHSRVTVQSLGQILLQSERGSTYTLAGSCMVSASNGDHYVTSNVGLTLAGGFVGPNPGMDAGPTRFSDYPAAPGITNYLTWMQGLNRVWNLIDGISGIFFACKFATDLAADVANNDAPQGASDIADQLLQTLGNTASGFGAAKSLHDVLASGGVPLQEDPAGSAMPSGSQAASALGAGDGVNVYGEGGVLIASPVGVNVYAGAGASIGSVSTTLWGVDTEVYGTASTKVTSSADTKMTSGGKTTMVSTEDMNLMSRTGTMGLRAKRIQLGYVCEGAPPSPAVDPSKSAKAAVMATELSTLITTDAAAMSQFVGDHSPTAGNDPGLTCAAWGAAGGAILAAMGPLFANNLRHLNNPPPHEHPTSGWQQQVDDVNTQMPDAGSASSAVIDAAKESQYQAETDDVVLKGKQRILLKSHDEVDVGAARRVRIRVGPMEVVINATSATDGAVTIGKATDNAYPRISLDTSQGTAEIAVGSDTRITLNAQQQKIEFLAGTAKMTLQHDSNVLFEETGITHQNGHFKVD